MIRHCARLCLKLDVIAGNTLFVDGSKFRANAGIGNSWTAEQCDERLKGIDQRIEEILDECERVDTQEAQEDSMVHLKQELAEQRRRKERIEAAVAAVERARPQADQYDRSGLCRDARPPGLPRRLQRPDRDR